MPKCISAVLALCYLFVLPNDAYSQSVPEVNKPGATTDLSGLDSFIEQTMHEWKVPGLAIAIVKDGNVIHSKGYGYRDVEKKLPVTSRTLFAIGSITKSFTVTGLGMLVDEDKLDWDIPIRTYLPDFQLQDETATEQMRASDLVTHRSGLPRHDFVWYGDATVSRGELFRRLRFLEPNKEFRTVWQYQNLMYLTAGVLCEKLSGATWEEFTRKRIVEPLGMRDVNFSVTDSQKFDNFAQPYAKVDNDIRLVPFHNLDAIGPAGSINANVEAMIRYVDFHIHQGKVQDKQLLSQNQAIQMRTPQMVMPSSTQSPRHEEIGDLCYGMGFMVTTYRGTRFVEHGGGIDGFASLLTFLPTKKAGVIVLTNLSGVNPVPTIVNRRVCDLVLGLEPVDWGGRIREQQLKNLLTGAASKKKSDFERKTGTSPTHPLADYAGRYQHPAYGVITIECAGTTLKLTTAGGLSASLSHYHYDVFETDEDPTGRFDQRKATFSYDKRGNIDRVGIGFEPAVSDIVFVRLPDESMKQKAFLEPLAGDYLLGQQVLSVTFKNDQTLMLTVPGQPTYELMPIRDFLFELKDLKGYSATFQKNEKGQVAQIVLHQPNGTFHAKRIMPEPENAITPAVYSKPPQNVLDILNAAPAPAASLSPSRQHLLLVHSVAYPPLAELAEPMLGLAGIRMNPRTNGPHRATHYVGLTLQQIPDGNPRALDVPENPRLGFPRWSPDGKRFAFTNTLDDGIELWIGDAATGELKRVPDLKLNRAYGDPPQWMPDSQAVLCQAIVVDRGPPPVAPRIPPGPTISESFGKKGPVRTYQDLLRNSHDEELFEYYAKSQLAIHRVADSTTVRFGASGIILSVDPSPDGKHLLVVQNHPPFSYLHTALAFPREIEVWDLSGKLQHKVASLPLADQVPIEGVPTGPRRVHWRPTEPATLAWIEALDEGDPKKKVPHRDLLRTLKFPFDEEPQEITKIEHRFSSLAWGENDGLLLLREYDRDRKWTRTFILDADHPAQTSRLIWDRSIHDRYGDPGDPVMRVSATGHSILWQNKDFLYLTGEGASEQGDRPFLDRFHLKTAKSERIFQCEDKVYESVVALTSRDASTFLTKRETTDDPPNYFLRSEDGTEKRALTDFPDPAPQLRAMKKELVTYPRKDGVQLSFTLYLPPDHVPGKALPTVVWAYPREFTDASTAGQVAGSPYRFTRLSGPSHLFFLTQGYAVLDAATMPVVGDPETANNTYIEQIVSSAQAAIDKAVEMGVTDRRRVGVGGHSYGAFMTANLLAHSDLFRAGVARSGAYNRTLTPFGFQSERRTLWEAPEIYQKVSPFMYAHQITEPILLIHGAVDDNPGTFPVQSDRLYQAIRGNGGHVRYVSLPHEAHGYMARESVEHTLYEMITWFDRYVKNAGE